MPERTQISRGNRPLCGGYHWNWCSEKEHKEARGLIHFNQTILHKLAPTVTYRKLGNSPTPSLCVLYPVPVRLLSGHFHLPSPAEVILPTFAELPRLYHYIALLVEFRKDIKILNYLLAARPGGSHSKVCLFLSCYYPIPPLISIRV